MRIPILTLLPVLTLSAAAAAQTPVNPNTRIEIPTAAPTDGRADHATIAMNERGDVFVTWSSSVYDLSGAQSSIRRVEGAFFRRIGQSKWERYPTITLGETDPTLMPGGTTIYPGGDICRKPDVVAVGSDFVVGWQRVEAVDSPNGRIEVAYIDEQGGVGDAIIHLSDASGIGYVVDSFDPTAASGMIDLAASSTVAGRVAASYVHMADRNRLSTGERLYDFDLRAVILDFTTPGAPDVGPINTLVTNIPCDDFIPGNPTGGRVLPDCEFDQWGNLIISYESFAQGRRISATEENSSRVHLTRSSVDAGRVMTLQNADVLMGTESRFIQRRPNVSKPYGIGSIDFAWEETQLPAQNTRLFHFRADYPNATDAPTLTELTLPAFPGTAKPKGPIPLILGNYHGILNATEEPVGFLSLTFPLPGLNQWFPLTEFNAVFPWRPAVDYLPQDPAKPTRALAAISCEGADSFRPAVVRVFMEIKTL